MDNYEYKIKTDQLRKMVGKGDYETAMRIADSIDWKKERDANLLAMVSQVYEKNEEYQDAKDILLMAYERAPVGKRFLYKLTELALKEGDTEEAEAYYREFCDLAGDDSRQYLLRYMILKARNAPVDQLIHALESYTSEELDERWMYELAELYNEAGDTDKCVSMCDKIMLMFGLGQYVDKAMELKMQHAPLTEAQMDLFENREKYEKRLQAVQESFRDGEEEETGADETQEGDAELRRQARLAADEPPESPDELGKTRVMTQLKRKVPQEAPKTPAVAAGGQSSLPAGEGAQKQEPMPAAGPDQGEKTAQAAPEELQRADAPLHEHFMIEARTPEKGLDFALALIKEIQKQTGIKTPVAKITGSNLNKRGVLANADKLIGRTLLVEEAGDLSPATLKELEALLNTKGEGTRVILVDNERQFDMMLEKEPELAGYFDRLTVEEVQIPSEPETEASPSEDEEMDIDEFAQYACDYAAGIDCSITGKSMLALYERIEIMEEDGIPLTRANAEALIEEAADKAEKPGLVGSIKGIFSSKYNKDGLLILREEHFIS